MIRNLLRGTHGKSYIISYLTEQGNQNVRIRKSFSIDLLCIFSHFCSETHLPSLVPGTGKIVTDEPPYSYLLRRHDIYVIHEGP